MSMDLGVVASSRKPDEHRLALHPAHLDRLPADVRDRIFLEDGYGERLGYSDAQLAPLVGGLLPRAEIFERCDVVVVPKPMLEDVAALGPGQVLWGWPHCVQD